MLRAKRWLRLAGERRERSRRQALRFVGFGRRVFFAVPGRRASVVSGPDVPANNSDPRVSGGAPPGPRDPHHTHARRQLTRIGIFYKTNPYVPWTGDLLSALLAGSVRSLSSSAETLAPSTPPAAAGDHPVLHTEQREAVSMTPTAPGANRVAHHLGGTVIGKILERKAQQPVKIDFKIFLTENTATHWEAVVQGSTIYLRLPGVLSSGSKESFMVLLDFAEERLGCTSCIVCVRKSRPDRAVVLRTFMFMGFQPLAPGAPPLAPLQHRHDYVFLYYSMR
ncbi:Ornithine decarboxylase antizyme [Eumeta japonica]|uniref:Ornithine decarboxylase antizyme n=1 Tax=Eumeta variegata TaxID=151549 RepID=A0A4C1ZZS5_EUMVA|nr:Ornithine decarboxylase antizyme [Eumeta japonica]